MKKNDGWPIPLVVAVTGFVIVGAALSLRDGSPGVWGNVTILTGATIGFAGELLSERLQPRHVPIPVEPSAVLGPDGLLNLPDVPTPVAVAVMRTVRELDPEELGQSEAEAAAASEIFRLATIGAIQIVVADGSLRIRRIGDGTHEMDAAALALLRGTDTPEAWRQSLVPLVKDGTSHAIRLGLLRRQRSVLALAVAVVGAATAVVGAVAMLVIHGPAVYEEHAGPTLLQAVGIVGFLLAVVNLMLVVFTPPRTTIAGRQLAGRILAIEAVLDSDTSLDVDQTGALAPWALMSGREQIWLIRMERAAADRRPRWAAGPDGPFDRWWSVARRLAHTSN